MHTHAAWNAELERVHIKVMKEKVQYDEVRCY